MRDGIVQELALKYAKFVDDKLFDQMATIMPPDVNMAAPNFDYKTLDEFVVQLDFLNTFSGTMHVISNQLGEWTDDVYEGETYCLASHVYEKDGEKRKLEMGIRYQDTIKSFDGVYKYARRYLNVVWEQDLPLTDGRGLQA